MTDHITPADVSPPILLEQPTDEEGVTQVVKKMDIREFRELGFLHEINRLILHPAGMALEVHIDPATGAESLGGVWDCRDDTEGVAYGENYISPAKAEAVALMIEARGPARHAELGYVIQPVAPTVRQLHMSVKDPLNERFTGPTVGDVGAWDEGEEEEYCSPEVGLDCARDEHAHSLGMTLEEYKRKWGLDAQRVVLSEADIAERGDQ